MNYSLEKLKDKIAKGEHSKFLFFWGHQKAGVDSINSNCLSQWYLSPFLVDNIEYPMAEHWMMAEKARLFDDYELLEQILTAETPGKAKMLGRAVRGFSQEKWEACRCKIVMEGNYYKFLQHPLLKEFLINTKQRILVEASPVDNIWGIGMEKSHAFATVPLKWRGLNLLGFSLMEVRDRLKDSSA